MKIKPILRLSAFALSVVVPAVLALLSPRPARGSVFETLLGFGTRMAPYLDDQRTTEKPRTIMLNGQTLHVAVGTTPHKGARVKDFYLDKYYGSQLALNQIATQVHDGKKAPPTEMSFGDDDEGGMVAFDLGDKLSLQTLKERYLKFVKTRRIGELGQVRFVKWTKEPGGGTRFLTMWTDDHFSVDKLVPPHGVDVEGSDLSGVPRIPGMTRVLAMEEKGKPWATRVYEGQGTVSLVASEMAAAMVSSGWTENRAFAKSSPTSVTMRFDYGERTALIAIDQSDKGLVDLAVVAKGG